MTQRIYGNIDNIARTGTVSATSFVPSTSYRRTSVVRTGGGQVSLSGDYTGAVDASFEVEVLNNTIVGSPIISAPVFSGVGNGTISSLSASGNARSIRVTLVDAGTRTLPAYVNFGPVSIEATTPGSGGNSLTLAINRTGLTATEKTDVTVPERMPAGALEFRGTHWNFGAATLLADGSIPESAERIRFEHQPYIYRQYRRYVNGEYVYSFSPPLREEVPLGTRIFTITGTLSATIGAETFTGIVTMYDLLSKIESQGSSVIVNGVVSKDLLPGGMGAVDVEVFTEPYLRRVSYDGGRYVRASNLTSVSVDSDAPTGIVTVTCRNASIQGAEVWEVETPAEVLANAVTGVAYTAGPVNFTIAEETTTADTTGVSAPPVGLELTTVARAEGEEIPVLCLDKARPVAGAKAREGQYTFVYSVRPTFADCGSIRVIGGPNGTCLGVEIDGGSMADLSAGAMTRVQNVEDWLAGLMSTDWVSSSSITEEENTVVQDVRNALLSAVVQLDAASAAWTAFDAQLTAIEAEATTLTLLNTGSYQYVVRQYMNDVLSEAGILPDFDGASTGGSTCWQDPGDTRWWVSKDGYLPAFTNHYYHSVRRLPDGEIESTQEFGFAPAIAGTPKIGDTITVTINGSASSGFLPRTYQEGDRFTFDVVNAAPLEFGGGQTGNNTLIWSVIDSSTGALAQYSLDLDSPAGYSNGGVAFTIAEGGIPFALGDEFRFAVEGGQFRWRKDAGSWSSNTQIGTTVSLSDGVSAVFQVGEAPSFVDGDTYEFVAESVNGPVNLIQPTDGALEFDDSTVIEISNTAGASVTDLLLFHEFGDDATVQLEGSDNQFSTSPLDVAVTVTPGVTIYSGDATAHARYRITIANAGTGARVMWAYLGTPWAPTLAGRAQRSRRFEGPRSGLNRTGGTFGTARSASIDFDWMDGANADLLESLLVHAWQYDQSRIGYVLSVDHLNEGGVGAFEVDDFVDRRTDYQAASKANRLVQTKLRIAGIV